jgi:hypothetical protein
MEADTQAALAIDEADDPARIERDDLGGFLLMIPTGRIVTAHRHMIPEGCDNERVPPDTRDFPAYSQVF